MVGLRKKIKRFFRARNGRIRALQAFNHIMIIPAVIYGDFLHWGISIVMYFCMFCIGIDIGVHRYFSHRSFDTNRLSEIVMAYLATLATVGSTISWVGMHRVHHQKSDRVGDPHSPFEGSSRLIGFLRSYFGFWSPYTAKVSGISDMRRDSLHVFLHQYYLLVIFTTFLFICLFDPILAVFVYCIPAVMCFHGASIIVTLGHIIGKKNHDTNDNSKDSVIVHWLTWGEGLHNTHHCFPKKHNLNIICQLPWYFFDLPGFIIENFFKTKR